MFKKIHETIQKESLILEGETIIVAFSGGPDSVYLVESLLSYQEKIPFEIRLMHLNHQIRGNKAFQEEDYARTYARKKGLILYAFRVDIPFLARKRKWSVEEAGRKIRYDRLNKLARKFQGKIATGHHGDDQVETILMNLIRGTSSKGLVAMKYQRGNILRPMLDLTKEEILSTLSQSGQSYCHDETNDEVDYKRNHIRHELIPFIEENYNPNFKQAVLRMGKTLLSDEQFLEKEARNWLEKILRKDPEGDYYLSINQWALLSKELHYRVVMEVCAKILGGRKDIGQKDLDKIRDIISGEKGRQYQLKDFVFFKDQDRVWIYKKEKPNLEEKVLELDREIIFNGYSIVGKIRPIEERIPEKNKFYFSLDLMDREIKVGIRKPGMIFTPYKGKGKKKLKDFFIDEKIARFKRDRIPLVTVGEEILAIIGYRRSDLYKVHEGDKKVIEISWRKL